MMFFARFLCVAKAMLFVVGFLFVSLNSYAVVCPSTHYDDNGVCMPCPEPYTYDDGIEGKTSITECKIQCPAGTWVDQPDVSRFGYTRLEYLESDGSAYIDTGHKHTSTNIKGVIRIGEGNNPITSNINFLGNQNNPNNKTGYSVGWAPSLFKVWVEADNSRLNGPSPHPLGANTIHDLEYRFTATKRYITYDGQTKEGSHKGSIAANHNIHLFDNGAVQTAQIFKGRIYWITLYEDPDGDGEFTLFHNYVPAKRNADGKLGIFDTVSGDFFYNAGKGTFTKGEDVTSPCVNVGTGYWAESSVVALGSAGTRTPCPVGTYSDSETGESAATCTPCGAAEYNSIPASASCKTCPEGYTYDESLGKTALSQCKIHCDAGTYLTAAGKSSCSACSAGKYCLGGDFSPTATNFGVKSCETEIASGWTSARSAAAKTDCYYPITLNKNGFSGTIRAGSGTGCSVVSNASGTTDAVLKLFYNTACTLPTVNLTQSGFAAATGWSTTTDISEEVSSISATTTTPNITTYYARKTCGANYYKSSENTCAACGLNSSTAVGNISETCTCNSGYTIDGRVNGSITSLTGCIPMDFTTANLHVGQKQYRLLSQRRTTPSICLGMQDSVYYVSLIEKEIQHELGVGYNNKIYTACDITGDYCIVNGVLHWADPNLYLKSKGQQYIDTGVVPDLNTAFEIAMADDTSNTYGLFGVKTGTTVFTNTGFGISLDNDKVGFFRNGTELATINKDSNYHVYYLSNTAASVDGVSYDFAPATTPINKNQSMYVFGFNHNGLAYDKTLSVKYVKIWQGDTLIRHLVPVPKDLVIGNFTVPSNGMFDIVNQQFYANGGISNFEYGKVQ
ncbi:MAG: hypothetical protein IKF41_02525 [Alphaproteobacteria bacterium]|nr:hypothetical protein [Alphaproteobacteria bacterium]